jgi:hypothetical protein
MLSLNIAMADQKTLGFLFSRMNADHDSALHFAVNNLGYSYPNDHFVLPLQDSGLPFKINRQLIH